MDGSKTRINDACVRFEADWQAGLRPRIEAYLPAEPSDPGRAGLLRELIRLEVALLTDDGSPARREEYDARFPGDPGAVDRGFRTGPEEVSSAFPSVGSEALVDSLREALASEEFNGRSAESGPRFTKRRDHARGGLGVVEVWFDHELNREVAVKRIHEHKADDPASRARFLQEGEITGNLEHPGIVPVYARGRDADGRLYYVMRFVRGESLKDAIAAFHEREAFADRGTRDFALRKLLGRFLDVGNAVEYAHSMGVLHRDLKPSNVMLGPYGETLVVDWGLAKILSRPENDSPATEPARGRSGWAETAAGIAMGTPAYMSPEQAEGDIAGLGPASDVYSLGATLYAILTSRSPIPGGPTSERLATVRRGEFPRPRAIVPWIDRALEAVCLKAMRHQPKDRYPSCRAMADDIERWLADEPVSAWREPWSRRVTRLLKRHRTSATAVVATSVVGLALLLVGWAWRADQRRRIGDAARVAMVASDREAVVAVAWLRVNRWPEAVAFADKAVAFADKAVDLLRTGGGHDADRTRAEAMAATYHALLRDGLVLRDLDKARATGSAILANTFDTHAQLDGIQRAFSDYGIDLGTLAFDDAAHLIHDSRVGDELRAALLEWAILGESPETRARLVRLSRASDDSDRFEPIRVAISQADGTALARASLDPAVGPLAPSLLAVVCRILILLEQEDAAVKLLEPSQRDHSDDFWLNYYLGSAYASPRVGRLHDALAHLTASKALRPKSAAVASAIGIVQMKTGDLDRAISSFQEAIDRDPEYVTAYFNLGTAFLEKGDLGKAVDSLQTALSKDPKYVSAYYNLGEARWRQGKRDDSLAAYLAATREVPQSAEAHFQLGRAWLKRSKLASYEDAVTRALARPGVPRTTPKGDRPGIKELNTAVASFEEAVRLRPKHLDAQRELAAAKLLKDNPVEAVKRIEVHTIKLPFGEPKANDPR